MLSNEHCIPVAVEPVPLANGFLIRAKYQIPARERRHQHQQRRSWQVKVGHQRADNLELESWRDEEIGFAGARGHAALMHPRRVFERPRRGRPDSHDAPAVRARGFDGT